MKKAICIIQYQDEKELETIKENHHVKIHPLDEKDYEKVNHLYMLELTKEVVCPHCKKTNTLDDWYKKTREFYETEDIVKMTDMEARESFYVCPSCSKELMFEDIIEQ